MSVINPFRPLETVAAQSPSEPSVFAPDSCSRAQDRADRAIPLIPIVTEPASFWHIKAAELSEVTIRVEAETADEALRAYTESGAGETIERETLQIERIGEPVQDRPEMVLASDAYAMVPRLAGSGVVYGSIFSPEMASAAIEAAALDVSKVANVAANIGLRPAAALARQINRQLEKAAGSVKTLPLARASDKPDAPLSRPAGVRTFLDVSCRHLSETTLNWLQANEPNELGLSGMRTGDGFFLYAPTARALLSHRRPAAGAPFDTIPDDLWAAFCAANERDCRWIMFDWDAEYLAGLRIYDTADEERDAIAAGWKIDAAAQARGDWFWHQVVGADEDGAFDERSVLVDGERRLYVGSAAEALAETAAS